MNTLLLAFILSTAIALFAWRTKMLSGSGSAATFVLAFVIFGLGSWKYTIPMVAFFLLSSILSKMWKDRKRQFAETFEKSGTRDAFQVAANGGIAALALLLSTTGSEFPWYIVYLCAIASVTADTWATEIGVLSRKQPRFILTGRPVPHGTSGAISVTGTLGGILGAACIACTGCFFAPIPQEYFLLILFAGAAGNIIDSVLGATIQASFACTVCGAQTERDIHHGTPARLVSGYRAIRNDAVNVLSALGATILSAALLYLFR